MKNTLLTRFITLAVLALLVSSENLKHRLKALKSLKSTSSLKAKTKKAALNLKMLAKTKSLLKAKRNNMGMEDEKTQRVYRDDNGNCIWGDL